MAHVWHEQLRFLLALPSKFSLSCWVTVLSQMVLLLGFTIQFHFALTIERTMISIINKQVFVAANSFMNPFIYALKVQVYIVIILMGTSIWSSWSAYDHQMMWFTRCLGLGRSPKTTWGAWRKEKTRMRTQTRVTVRRESENWIFLKNGVHRTTVRSDKLIWRYDDHNW